MSVSGRRAVDAQHTIFEAAHGGAYYSNGENDMATTASIDSLGHASEELVALIRKDLGRKVGDNEDALVRPIGSRTGTPASQEEVEAALEKADRGGSGPQLRRGP